MTNSSTLTQKESAVQKQKTTKRRQQSSHAPEFESMNMLLQRAAQNPQTLSRVEALHLQNKLGNQRVQRLMRSKSPLIQTKLPVNAVGDRYKQEAITGPLVTTQINRQETDKRTKNASTNADINQVSNFLRDLNIGGKNKSEAVYSLLETTLDLFKVPGRSAVKIPKIVELIAKENYRDATIEFMDLGIGTLSEVYGMYKKMGTILPRLAWSTVAAEIFTPLALVAEITIGIAEMPDVADKNACNIYYGSDLASILAARIFASPSVSIHQQLIQQAGTTFYPSPFISKEDQLKSKLLALRKARLDADKIWNRLKKHQRNIPELIERYGSATEYACLLGDELESKLDISPRVGSILRGKINELAG